MDCFYTYFSTISYNVLHAVFATGTMNDLPSRCVDTLEMQLFIAFRIYIDLFSIAIPSG